MGKKKEAKKRFKEIADMILNEGRPLTPSRSIEPVAGMDEDTAYDGLSNLPPKRELTARERDVLVRVLQAIVRPHYVRNLNDPFAKKSRRALAKYANLNGDAEILQVIANVLNPRDE